MSNKLLKKFPTIACCGLDCGLCPVYYTKGPSRCPGCCGPDFSNKHPSCAIVICCVKKKNFETCAECEDFPYQKLKMWDLSDSFISHKKSLVNLKEIKKISLEKFIEQQQKRINFLEFALNDYNEGRSKSFYCIASALLSISFLESCKKTLKQKMSNENIKNIKEKSKILKDILNKGAIEENVDLKLRKIAKKL
jgi:hypothetical protein